MGITAFELTGLPVEIKFYFTLPAKFLSRTFHRVTFIGWRCKDWIRVKITFICNRGHCMKLTTSPRNCTSCFTVTQVLLYFTFLSKLWRTFHRVTFIGWWCKDWIHVQITFICNRGSSIKLTTVFDLNRIVIRLNSDSSFILLHIFIKVSDEPFIESLSLDGGVKIESMFKSLSSVIEDVASN